MGYANGNWLVEERILPAAYRAYDAYASGTGAWVPSFKILTQGIIHNMKGGEMYGKQCPVS